MEEISVINTISVPEGMEGEAGRVRAEYVAYFRQQDGFVGSTFYKALDRDGDGSIRYVNIVVWASRSHFESVVNLGFQNEDGENRDGRRVLGKGFPPPIAVSPGQYTMIESDA